MDALLWGDVVLARVSGGELTVIGLTSVFASLIGLVVVLHAFNWWDQHLRRRESMEEAGCAASGDAGGASAGACPEGTAAPAASDRKAETGVAADPAVRVAIALALAMSAQTSSANVPYRIDGAGAGGLMSAWRMAIRRGRPPRGG